MPTPDEIFANAGEGPSADDIFAKAAEDSPPKGSLDPTGDFMGLKYPETWAQAGDYAKKMALAATAGASDFVSPVTDPLLSAAGAASSYVVPQKLSRYMFPEIKPTGDFTDRLNSEVAGYRNARSNARNGAPMTYNTLAMGAPAIAPVGAAMEVAAPLSNLASKAGSGLLTRAAAGVGDSALYSGAKEYMSHIDLPDAGKRAWEAMKSPWNLLGAAPAVVGSLARKAAPAVADAYGSLKNKVLGEDAAQEAEVGLANAKATRRHEKEQAAATRDFTKDVESEVTDAQRLAESEHRDLQDRYNSETRGLEVSRKERIANYEHGIKAQERLRDQAISDAKTNLQMGRQVEANRAQIEANRLDEQISKLKVEHQGLKNALYRENHSVSNKLSADAQLADLAAAEGKIPGQEAGKFASEVQSLGHRVVTANQLGIELPAEAAANIDRVKQLYRDNSVPILNRNPEALASEYGKELRQGLTRKRAMIEAKRAKMQEVLDSVPQPLSKTPEPAQLELGLAPGSAPQGERPPPPQLPAPINYKNPLELYPPTPRPAFHDVRPPPDMGVIGARIRALRGAPPVVEPPTLQEFNPPPVDARVRQQVDAAPGVGELALSGMKNPLALMGEFGAGASGHWGAAAGAASAAAIAKVLKEMRANPAARIKLMEGMLPMQAAEQSALAKALRMSGSLKGPSESP